MGFAKGDRVKVVGGRKSMGVTGVIFWIGDNKYGEGQRFGVRGDDGETHWVPEEHCEATQEVMEVPEGPALEKGDRVQWSEDDRSFEGSVFWLGPNKFGPGTRVGVKDDDGETHWFDSRRLTRLDEAIAPSPHPDGPAPEGPGFDGPDEGAGFGGGPASWEEAPPVDDAWAHSVGEPEGADDDIPF